MANNTIAIKRSSVSGKKPNTTAGSIASNSSYILPGELALNMPDKLLYTSNGTDLITFGSKRVTATPNTTDISNSTYIAAGDFAIDPTNKKVYSSTGSVAFEVGSSVSSLAVQQVDAGAVKFTGTLSAGDITTTLMQVNTTAIFVGNTTANATVNSAILQIIDPDHSTVLAADTIRVTNTSSNIAITPASIAVSNSQSNSRLTPSLIFVGNNTVNAQFNVAGGAASFIVTSYSYDGTTGFFTFNFSGNHGLFPPFRGTYFTITNLTGRYATLLNNKSLEIYDAPTDTSIRISKPAKVSISTTPGSVTRLSKTGIPVTATSTTGIKVLGSTITLTAVEAGTGIITVSDTTGIPLNTAIYFPTTVGNFISGSVYWVIEVVSGTKLKLSASAGGNPYTSSTLASSQSISIIAHRNTANIPLYTSALLSLVSGTTNTSQLTIGKLYYIQGIDWASQYANISLGTSQYADPVSISAVTGIDFQLEIGGTATITTAYNHNFTTGQTILVNGVGADPSGSTATFDGSYIVNALNSTQVNFTNNPPIGITPASMYIDHYVGAGTLPSGSREVLVNNVTSTGKINFGITNPSVAISATAPGTPFAVGQAIRFFGTQDGVALPGGATAMGGIDVGKTYYILTTGPTTYTPTTFEITVSETYGTSITIVSVEASTGKIVVTSGDMLSVQLNSPIYFTATVGNFQAGTTYYVIGRDAVTFKLTLSTQLGGTAFTQSTLVNPTAAGTPAIAGTKPVTWTATSQSSLSGFKLYAYNCGTTVNYRKDNHGLTNKALVQGVVSASANATIGYICFPFYPSARQAAGIAVIPPSPTTYSNWSPLIIPTTNIGNTYNTGLQLNYKVQGTAVLSTLDVIGSSGAYTAGLPFGTADATTTSLAKTSLFNVILPAPISTTGIYGGYGTLSGFTDRTLTLTVDTPYIKAIKASGVINVSSTTKLEVGQRILTPDATVMGVFVGKGLAPSTYYYITAIAAVGAAADITLVNADDQTTVPTTVAFQPLSLITTCIITVTKSAPMLLQHLNNTTVYFKDDGKGYISASVGAAAATYATNTVAAGWSPVTATPVDTRYLAGIKPGTAIIQVSSINELGLAVGDQVSLTAGATISPATHGYYASKSNDYFITSIGSAYNYTLASGGAAISVRDVKLAQTKGGTDYVYLKSAGFGTGAVNTQMYIKKYAAPYSAPGSQTSAGGVTFNHFGNTSLNNSGAITQISDYAFKLDTASYVSKNVLWPQIFQYPFVTATNSNTSVTKAWGYIQNTTSTGVVLYPTINDGQYNDTTFYNGTMIAFTGIMFGGLEANTPYYITGSSPSGSTTALTLSKQKGGDPVSLIPSDAGGKNATYSAHYILNLPYATMSTAPFSTNDLLAIQEYGTGVEDTSNIGLYTLLNKTAPNYNAGSGGTLKITPYTPNRTDASKTVKNGVNYYVYRLINFTGTTGTNYTSLPVINKCIPLDQNYNSQVNYNYTNIYAKKVARVIDANNFSIELTSATDPGFSYNMFGSKSSPITVSSTLSSVYSSTDTTLSVISNRAYIDLPAETVTGTSFSASSTTSSYVEIANSSAAVKITPSTFYNGNTTANLFSNSSFLGISTPDNLLEVTPSYIFLGKAVNGVPLINSDGTGSYFYANSTNQFIGNATKYTIFDGAGNQINRGSSITVTDDINSVYIDDFSVSISNPDSCTSITSTSATFAGNVAIAGPFSVQGTRGVSGQILLTDSTNAYWGESPPTNPDVTYNFTNTISFAGQLTIANNVIYNDSTLTYNDASQNYTTTNAYSINLTANTAETVVITPKLISINSSDAIANSTTINPGSITLGNTSVQTTVNSTAFSGTIYASGSTGYTGQVLRSDGSGAAYWDDGTGAVNARQIYTADGSTSTFTVTAGYTPNNLDVYMNGVKLQNGTEVSVSSGSTFTINSGNPASGTIIEVVGGLVAGITSAVPYIAATATSVTINPSIYNGYFYTALASGLTINASTTGSPVNGTRMIFRFKDNGTARSLTWTTSGTGSFRTFGTSLPGYTVVGKTIYVGCIYNADEQYWDVLAAAVQD